MPIQGIEGIEDIVNDTHYIISQLSETEDIERAKQTLHKNVVFMNEIIKLTMQLYKATDAALDKAMGIANKAIEISVEEVEEIKNQLQQ